MNHPRKATPRQGILASNGINWWCSHCSRRALSLPLENCRGCGRKEWVNSYALTAYARSLPSVEDVTGILKGYERYE